MLKKERLIVYPLLFLSLFSSLIGIGCIFQRNRPLITVEADHLLRCQADQFRSEATPAFAY
jgi:hypothetical protein